VSAATCIEDSRDSRHRRREELANDVEIGVSGSVDGLGVHLFHLSWRMIAVLPVADTPSPITR
jgi:hypothetical protein